MEGQGTCFTAVKLIRICCKVQKRIHLYKSRCFTQDAKKMLESTKCDIMIGRGPGNWIFRNVLITKNSRFFGRTKKNCVIMRPDIC